MLVRSRNQEQKGEKRKDQTKTTKFHHVCGLKNLCQGERSQNAPQRRYFLKASLPCQGHGLSDLLTLRNVCSSMLTCKACTELHYVRIQVDHSTMKSSAGKRFDGFDHGMLLWFGLCSAGCLYANNGECQSIYPNCPLKMTRIRQSKPPPFSNVHFQ